MSLPEADRLLFFIINNGLQNSFFDRVMPFITSRPFLVFLPFVLLIAVREKKKILPVIAAALLSVGFADAVSHILKELFMRQRPCNALEGVHLLVGCGKSFSLPSNHASNSVALAMTFWLILRTRMSLLLLPVAAAICFSRVYVGVHYPGDVIAGAAVGTAVAVVTSRIFRWAERIYAEKDYYQALILVLITISFFRLTLIATGPFDLVPDEAHYWEWSRRLDWSYYSKGPMIAWLIRAGTFILGDTPLGVRIFAVIFSALNSILLYRMGRDLYNERVGLAAGLVIQIIPLFSVFGLLFTIDSPFVFFWILSLYLFHRIIRKQEAAHLSDWAVLGISVGLGLLTKYTMAFFLFSALLYLVFNRNARHLLKKSGPYVSAAISLAVFSPVIFWNAAHDWVTLKHTAGQAHLQAGMVLDPDSFVEFLLSQAGVITPLLFILLIYSVWRLRKTDNGSFFFWFSMPIIVFFLAKSVQGKVQANWAMTGYISAIVSFSAYFIGRWGDLRAFGKTLTISAVVMSLGLALLAHDPARLKLPDKLDPSRRLSGWRELGKEASVVYAELAPKGPLFVFSNSYQVSSELAFYMDGHPVTYCANLGRRMNQYDLWPGFEGLIGQNAVYVRTKEHELPDEVSDAFAGCTPKEVTVITKLKKTRKFTIFKCYDFKGFKSQTIESF